MYEQDGAAIGMLFHAKNSKALAIDFQKKAIRRAGGKQRS